MMSGKLFRVSPSVVKADSESTVTVKSYDSNFKFIDALTYKVTFIPMDNQNVSYDEKMSLLGYEQNRKVFEVKPINGELKLSYFFEGEQEWSIHISCDEYEPYQNPLYKHYVPYWDGLINYPKNGINVSVYSLGKLFGTVPKRGDFHLHTSESDGNETPEMTAACYRKAGFDVIAVTDHNVYDKGKKAREKFDFVKNFEILTGEEVHNGYVGMFHMVNIGSSYSVNDVYLNNMDYINKEVEKISKTTHIPEGVDKNEYLHRVVLYNEIKKSGGYVIFPHPYWKIQNRYHVEEVMSRAIIKNKLCDAFEIIGGCTPEGNNLQTALYSQLRLEGVNIPIVGSSDSHCVLSGNGAFNRQMTILFAKDKETPIDTIAAGRSVAVEAYKGENVRVYGDFEYVRYAHFLLRNYFPHHDELCMASGQLMIEYIMGEDDLVPAIEKIEEKTEKYKKEFFGL